jgi:tetratricopeptide (TPR) repeat protein
MTRAAHENPHGGSDRKGAPCRARLRSGRLILAAGLVALLGLVATTAESGPKPADPKLAAIKKKLEAEITAALGEAENQRKELHQMLEDPHKVQTLLSDLSRWELMLTKAHASWKTANSFAAIAPDLIDKSLLAKVKALGEQLKKDRQDFELARKLDEIRLKAGTLMEGKLNPGAAAKEYPAVFQQAGLDVAKGEPAKVAKQLTEAPIRYALVAALDHWASVLPANSDLLPRLLEAARKADPDPWRDQVRDAKNWQDVKTLGQLAGKANVAQQSPHILLLVAERLHAAGGKGAPLLQKALLHYPADFWLHFTLGAMTQGPIERAGYFRAALAIRPGSVPALNNLGAALHGKGDVDGAIACYQKALSLDPKYAGAHTNLGNALFDKNDLDGAIACYKKALEIDADDAHVHYNLANALQAKGDLDGAIKEYHMAIKLDPKYAEAHNNLGSALAAKKDLEGAILEYHKAIALDPTDALAHWNLGNALYAKKDLDGAITWYKKAIKLDPKYAAAHMNLGTALAAMKDLAGAVACFQKAIALDPELAEAHAALGQALLGQGHFAEAAQATAQALKLLPPNSPLHASAQKQQVLCQQLLALDQKLAAVLQGQVQPKDAAEQLDLANLCQRFKHQYADAAKFYAAAFAAEPKLAEDLNKSNRYNAACAAVLAAAGQGKTADKLDAQAKAKLRQQALDWLRADLALWQKQAQGGTASSTLTKVLSHWQTDPDLTSVRDFKALGQLPEAELQDWLTLWADVAQLLQKTKK